MTAAIQFKILYSDSQKTNNIDLELGRVKVNGIFGTLDSTLEKKVLYKLY